jgi:DNA-binding response OmpR family regulator
VAAFNAQVRLLRRELNEAGFGSIQVGTVAALAGGTLIPLARREWEVLAALVETPGRAKSSKELAWGNPSAVKYACRRLRRKLALCGVDGVVTYHRWWGYRYIGPVRKVATIQEALGVEQSASK